MFFLVSKQGFSFFLMILVLLTACTGQSNYAPVVSHNGELTEGQQDPLPNNRNHNKIDQGASKRKYHRSSNRGLVYSVGLNSGYGYPHRPLANYPAPAHQLIGMEKVKFSIPAHAGQLTHEEEKVKTRSSKKNEDSLVYGTGSEDKKSRVNSGIFKKTNKRQKKSIISIDNKNILELNFGWPIKGRVLKSFSPGYNKGIDIAGKLGQLVNAAEAGEVVYCGQGLIGFGQLLIIKHNKVYLSAYANNRRVLVKEGQQVEKGQAIAEVGKIGTKKQASLHFEIRKNGSPVNPLKLLPKR